MQDFRRFMRQAKRRNLRVIIELVINHTSDQHPWFKRARRGKPGGDARNWYVWSDSDHRYAGTRIIFNDTEKSNWAWDPVAEAYYWHRFFSHQPDLNFDNPRVVRAMIQVMRTWLDLGVDGFRLDAIPYLCEREGTNNENLPETHAIIKQIRAELDAYAPGKLLLAEANQWPEDVSAYFGDGDECHMAYHFPLMPRIYMAIAQEDRFPIADILRQTPEIPANCQWALFLRNHDELTLEMVTDVERDYLWSTYATDPRARINLGIRRRLAPLMDNDRRKIELMNSLLLSFPGTPIIYYGDEIGMGDNIYLGDRNGVRTPMQWTPDRNGGFSRCDPARLYPADDHGPGLRLRVGQRRGAVAQPWLAAELDQAADLGAQIEPGLRPRIACVHPADQPLGAGLCSPVSRTRFCSASPTCRARRRPPRSTCRRGADASRSKCSAARASRPSAIIPMSSRLAPYGFFWFQLCETDGATIESPSIVPEFETLVLASNWTSLPHRPFAPCARARRAARFPRRPPLVRRTRQSVGHRQGGDGDPARAGECGLTLAVVETEGRAAAAQYLLPLTIKWRRFDRERRDPHALAAVRRGPREGALLDATADADFIAFMLENMQAGTTLDGRDGWRLEFRPSAAFAESGAVADRDRSRGRYRAVQHHRAGRHRLRGQAVPSARARYQSGNRGGPLPDRDGRLCEHAAAPGYGRAGR